MRAAAAFGDGDVVRQIFHGAVEQVARFQRLHQALLEAEIVEPAALRQRQRQRLQIIVAQHERGHVIGHLAEHLVSLVERDGARAHRLAERDLDIHLDVGGVDAGGIVDGIGVEPHAVQRGLDAPALRHAEIGALADHLAFEIPAGDADRIVGAIARRIVALVGCAHIGADAAEPEQIDRHFQDRIHDQLRRRAAGLSGRAAPAFPADSGISLAEREKTPPPLEIRLLS